MNIKVNICGVFFDNLTMEQAVEKTCNQVEQKHFEASVITVANQDILNKLGKYKDLTISDINSSFLIIPDGYSILAGGKFLGTPLKERVTGPDFMDKIMSISAEKNYKHFFLGAAEGVALLMVDKFVEKYPDLNVVGCYSPPFGDFSDDVNDNIIDLVNKSEADFVWVSFGCPKQEWWISRNKHAIKSPIIAGVGAAFDFHSGNKKRAPVFIQKIGFEWLYRIFQEPSRLFMRYFSGGINYGLLLIKQRFSSKRS